MINHELVKLPIGIGAANTISVQGLKPLTHEELYKGAEAGSISRRASALSGTSLRVRGA
jgi:hypothetical protein